MKKPKAMYTVSESQLLDDGVYGQLTTTARIAATEKDALKILSEMVSEIVEAEFWGSGLPKRKVEAAKKKISKSLVSGKDYFSGTKQFDGDIGSFDLTWTRIDRQNFSFESDSRKVVWKIELSEVE